MATCPKCGAQVSDQAVFCPKCGASITDGVIPEGNYIAGSNMQRKNNAPLIAALIAVPVIIFIIAVTLAFMYGTHTGIFAPKATPTPTPTAVPTAEPTPAPTDVPAPTPEVKVVYVTPQPPQPPQPTQAPPVKKNYNAPVTNPTYYTYSDSDYGFSCAYPSHFKVYNDGGLVTRYTAQTADGSARIKIAGTPAGSATVSSELNNYISEHSGSVPYKTSGSDYYAVNVNNGVTRYYKYCKFKNGNMYWFEFIYPNEYENIYDGYINDIYNSFTIY